ncbi:MAG TPA: cysteine synthase family protein [Armatimonadota bacterium]|nr:cysteine synthase family protein [Armatimonadota bacterium]
MIGRTRPVNVLDLVGKTPLLSFNTLTRDLPPGVELYAKAEWYNPGGSVKDRPALNMILEAERAGQLTPHKIILDATSGNTGIALAMIGAARGYRVRLCLPANASDERKRLLLAYGAELVLTSPLELTDGAQREARRLYEEEPELYFYCDQYGNENNWKSHYHTTAVEIWEQTEGRITHWVSGLGTTGTFVGTTRRLRELNPRIRCISFQPDSPLNELEGLKHLDTALVPRIYDPTVADEDRAADSDEAVEWCLRLAREEGVLVGPSSGAAMAVAMEVARELRDGVVVTLFPDGASKYLGRPYWTE